MTAVTQRSSSRSRGNNYTVKSSCH